MQKKYSYSEKYNEKLEQCLRHHGVRYRIAGDGCLVPRLGNQTLKRAVNSTMTKGMRVGVRETGKALAYYAKSTSKYYKVLMKGAFGDFVTSIGITIATSSYMKGQYRYMFGR